MKTTRVGVSLLLSNLADQPVHLKAAKWAMQSLLESDLRQFDWAIQIVDNNSSCIHTKNWLYDMRNRFGKIQTAYNKENLGIARGRSQAHQLLRELHHPDFIIDIHGDHLFPVDWLTPLIARLQHPDYYQVGMISPALLTGNVHWCCEKLTANYDGDYDTEMNAIEDAAARNRRPDHIVPGLTHPAVLRTAMLEEIGDYDVNLPGLTNYEDTELMYRARLAGWETMIDFASVVYHHYVLSRIQVRGWGEHNRDFKANQLYCIEKHGEAFREFSGPTLGAWMDEAYGVKEARA